MRNSPTKPFRPGTPIEESITTVKTTAKIGATFWSPLNCAISRVWRRSLIIPTMRKRAPVDTPWLIICITLPLAALLVKANVPSTMNPRWATDEYATSRFRSFCTVATMAP